jgi:hypothetical protein
VHFESDVKYLNKPENALAGFSALKRQNNRNIRHRFHGSAGEKYFPVFVLSAPG